MADNKNYLLRDFAPSNATRKALQHIATEDEVKLPVIIFRALDFYASVVRGATLEAKAISKGTSAEVMVSALIDAYLELEGNK